MGIVACVFPDLTLKHFKKKKNSIASSHLRARCALSPSRRGKALSASWLCLFATAPLNAPSKDPHAYTKQKRAKSSESKTMDSSSGAMVRRATSRRPNAVSTFVRQRPKAAATLSLWMLGLFIAFLAPAPIASTFCFCKRK